jgi:hypothetical protein
MLDDLREAFGAPGSFCAGSGKGADWERLLDGVESSVEIGKPVCILGTSLAFAAWLEELARSDVRLTLPAGSRAIDTGGAKGSADLDRAAVVGGLGERLGIPPACVVNEFGMTELCSQRYDSGARDDGSAGPLSAPPWLRTRAVDPVTLEVLPDGTTGVLSHFDLANAGSVCHVLTEDLGKVRDNRLEWHGRAAGAPPRGCSLATAELLAAQSDA